MNQYTAWRRFAAEFLGTAFLVLIGVGSVPALAIARDGQAFGAADLGFIALAFGGILIVTVYSFGYVSGNHINPAVTLALALGGKVPWRDVPGYVLAQLLGAIAGSALILVALGPRASELGLGVAGYDSSVAWHQAFAAEFIGTFLLIFTIIAVTHKNATPHWAGLPIGLVLFAAIVTLGSTTGASLNPARSAGPMLIQQLAGGAVDWAQLPVYVTAQLLAGFAAAFIAGAVLSDKTPAISDPRE